MVRFSGRWHLFKLGRGLGFTVRLRFGFNLWFGIRFRLWLRLDVLVQEFTGALFQRREIIVDAPGDLVSIRGELDAADQLRRGLELDLSVRGERFLHRT